jgi:molybdate-binding protein/transcriptional regulator with XRE-family HTH domain
MVSRAMLENDVRAVRTRLGWSQAQLAARSGLSRAGISAIETGRLVPSTAAALAVAAALGCTVDALFRLPGAAAVPGREEWAWPPTSPSARCRYWRAEIAGRQYLYPVEVSPLGLLPHDGTVGDRALHEHFRTDPGRTLVLACCDPAVGLLAAELARQAELRLIVLPRSSRAALDLLARGLVHAAGVHLARSDHAEGNAAAVRQHLAAIPGPDSVYHLLRIADWDEGIALGPRLGLRTIQDVVVAKLRWIVREPGSGAQQCLDEVIGRRDPDRGGTPRPQLRRAPRAHDHRGVADAIRGDGADAGICLRLTSEEAGLSFLSVRQEAYEFCLPDALLQDPRTAALLRVVRSAAYRRLLADLPGYDSSRTGELQPLRIRRP